MEGGHGVVGDVGGLNSLAGSLGECVLNISTSNLGDGVTVLNLDGNNLNLGVINTVGGGDLPASVLHGGHIGVGNSGSNRQGDRAPKAWCALTVTPPPPVCGGGTMRENLSAMLVDSTTNYIM